MAGIVPTEHIVAIDDDPRMLAMLARYFGRMNYQVTTYTDGSEIVELLGRTPVHVVLLDLILPKQDGRQLIREIRRVSSVPIIMLTGDQDIDNRISVLEDGADDCIRKPFELRELLVRVRNVRRRSTHRPPVAASRSFRVGGCTIDMDLGAVRHDSGRALDLTGAEFRLLACLAQHADTVVSRDRLAALVVDRERAYEDRSIDVLVAKLRRKLSVDPQAARAIETVRGVGYRLRTAASDAADAVASAIGAA